MRTQEPITEYITLSQSGDVPTGSLFALVPGNVLTQAFSGSVIDGKISGATVFTDLDGDGVQDEGEPTTTTDAQGNFSFPEGTPAGALVFVGGTDISTGLPFTGKMTAPDGATVVTPITTLIDQLAAQDTDPDKDTANKVAEAQSKLKTLLGCCHVKGPEVC